MAMKRLKRMDEPAELKSLSCISPSASGYRYGVWIRHQPLAQRLCPHCLLQWLAEDSNTETTPHIASMTRDSRKYGDQAALDALTHMVGAVGIDPGEENNHHTHGNGHLELRVKTCTIDTDVLLRTVIISVPRPGLESIPLPIPRRY